MIDRRAYPAGLVTYGWRVRRWEASRAPFPAPLAAEGVRFVVVGSAALWLHGVRVPVGDLDVVPETDEANLDRLCGAASQFW